MPGRDGTGPVGMGAIFGRGMGSCRGTNRAVRFNRCSSGYGHGFARNGSGRLGFSKTRTENDFLTEQKSFLENRLEIINKRLESL